MATDATPRHPLTARPTVYNGIQMRSRLEARYAAWLDYYGMAWTYEPHCFASANGQYLPDFKIEGAPYAIDREPRTVYVEVKPTLEIAMRQSPWRDKAQIIWESEPDALFLLDASEDFPYLFDPALDFTCHVVWTAVEWMKLGLVQVAARHNQWDD